MRRTGLALSLVALALVTWLTAPAAAQETKSARGTVTALAGNSITVKAGDRELKFTVDDKTTVNVEGGGTASRAAAAAGKAGPKLAELVKVGDPVEVRYHEMTGSLHAVEIRRVPSAGPGGGTTSDQKAETKAETSNGTVEAVTASSLTITGSSGGGAKFTQTFTIDGNTKVIGKGAGTAAAAKGGKLVITDYVSKGDRVTVTYHKVGSALHAAEVRVTMQPK